MEKLSKTTFKLASHFNSKKFFHRHISNISRWNGPIPDKNKSTIQIDQGISQLATDVEASDFILAREDEDTNIVDLGKLQKGMKIHSRPHVMDGLQQIY